MNRLIETMVAVLRQFEELYNSMLPIMDQEKKAVLSSDIEVLNSIAAEKATIVAGLKDLDQRRMLLLQDLSKYFDIPYRQMNLSVLAKLVGPLYDTKFIALQKSLNHVLAKIRKTNDENRLLIGHCLKIVRNSLGFFDLCSRSTSVYDASGDVSDAARRNGRFLSNSI
jgi:flagellar biosynthesis/type III secretory pathway chaperone